MTKIEKWFAACITVAVVAGVAYDATAMFGQDKKTSDPGYLIACPGDRQLESLDCHRNHNG